MSVENLDLAKIVEETGKDNPGFSHSIHILLFIRKVLSKSTGWSLIRPFRELTIIPATTNQDFILQANNTCNLLKSMKDENLSTLIGTEIFLRILSDPMLMAKDFDEWKSKISLEVDKKIECYLQSREKATACALPFIKDDMTILLHSYSTAVMNLLNTARKSNRRLRVFVTTSGFSHNKGPKTLSELRAANISAELIADAAVGYIMEQVDIVIVGAEGIVQTGGIINQIGTFSIAIVAKEFMKPFYVIAEQYKFLTTFPLSQSDIPIHKKPFFTNNNGDIEVKSPKIDYTPPEYITLLFTDLGTLTPIVICKEFLKFL